MSQKILATFTPCQKRLLSGHNWHKTAVFMTLYDFTYSTKGGASLFDMSEAIPDSNYSSLKSSLYRWRKWGYIRARATLHNGRPVLLYSLSPRGERFLDIVPVSVLQTIQQALKSLS
jgi:hypothetical protein